MSKGGWIVKFNDVEVERCYAVSFDYDMWEYTVNNQVTKKFPASGISTIKIEKPKTHRAYQQTRFSCQ